MNIYLDIDGVLLANEYNLSEGAVDLIKRVTEKNDVYWLTTQCMDGDPSWAIEYINRASDEDLTPWLNKIKPTTWKEHKTEAIDFTKPFYWLDDDLYKADKAKLEEHGSMSSFINIDLQKDVKDLINNTKKL